MTTKTKKRGKKFGCYDNEFPTTVGPAAEYVEYKPDLAMRLAMQRAARDQPSLLSLASQVPAYGDQM